ncbi:hypothetical protein K501DRAFT_269130 [Backusella circina FSU 941]|nr:hypothetical protein K501DRAFT_269130 [Backusella circina FSU 941]
MVRTRSKNQTSQIKKGSSQDNSSTGILQSTNNTTTNKVTKRKTAPRTKCTRAKAFASGNNDNNKKPKNISLKERWVTDEKIEKLIHYVENDKMTLKDASKKANMGKTATYKYYGIYRDDPEHNIPTLGYDSRRGKSHFSYEKIEGLINSLVKDKLTLEEAAKKAGMHKKTAINYYAKYMMDPERKIPVRNTNINVVPKEYTQENIKKIIDYVDNEKMTVRDAAKRLNMGESSAYIYYNRYKNDPEKKIPIPNKKGSLGKKYATPQQIKDLIRYIVDDKLSLKNAATKAEIPYSTANAYYIKYLRHPNHEIPVPGKPCSPISRRCTDDQIKLLISYIVDDKLNVSEAARKIGFAPATGRLYYRKYLNDPNRKIPTAKKPKMASKCCTPEQIKNLIGYIVHDKLSITNASLKVGITRNTGSVYYQRYLEDPEHKIPVPQNRQPALPTPDQITRFLGYILDDNMSIYGAGRKAGLRRHQAYIYYNIYTTEPLRVDSRHATDEQVTQLVGYVNDDKMTIKAAAKKVNIPYVTALRIYNECKDNPNERILNRMDLYYKNLQTISDVYKNRQIKKEGDK